MIVFRYDKTFEGLLTAVFDAYSQRQMPDALLCESEVAPLFTEVEHTVVTDPEKSQRVWSALEKKLSRDVCNMLFFSWLSEESGVDAMIFRFIRRVFDEVGTPNTAAPIHTKPGTSSNDPNVCRPAVPASCHPEVRSERRQRISSLSLSPATDFSDQDILRIRQLAQKVSHEKTHLMQFTRFQRAAAPNADDGNHGDSTKSPSRQETFGSDPTTVETLNALDAGTFFAPVSPRYNALPIAIPYFRDRFRDQKWLIYDIKRRYGFYYDLEKVTEITMDDDAHLLDGRLDPNLLAKDEKLFQELWKTYFHSMAIEARINPRLQRQMLPKRFWHLLTEMQ